MWECLLPFCISRTRKSFSVTSDPHVVMAVALNFLFQWTVQSFVLPVPACLTASLISRSVKVLTSFFLMDGSTAVCDGVKMGVDPSASFTFLRRSWQLRSVQCGLFRLPGSRTPASQFKPLPCVLLPHLLRWAAANCGDGMNCAISWFSASKNTGVRSIIDTSTINVYFMS